MTTLLKCMMNMLTVVCVCVYACACVRACVYKVRERGSLGQHLHKFHANVCAL